MFNMVKSLLFGYINTNFIDGSSVFMTNLCNVLSKNIESNIDLLLAVPIKRNTILSDIERVPNINIIDPFSNENLKKFNLLLREQLTIEESAKLIIHYEKLNEYDHIFIRSLDVTKKLLELAHELINKTYSYITGITSSSQVLVRDEYKIFNEIEILKGKFICQTSEMKEHILRYIDIEESSIIEVNPMIPDLPFSYDEIFQIKDIYSTFVYTGKFAKEWNTIPMIVGFREFAETYEVELNVAGDQFNKHEEFEKFKSHAEYLLTSTENVNWYKALSRGQTLNLISNSDVGISWRSHDLDDSLELSTKLLEYCSLGKPPILNKTKMHVKIFGEDYPYYCNDMSSYIETLKDIIKYQDIYERNSQFVFNIAQEYTFTNIAKKLYRKLGYSDIFIESINLRKKLSFFEEYKLPSNKSFNLTNSINISDELSKTREYAKEANEKYKKAMKQLTE